MILPCFGPSPIKILKNSFNVGFSTLRNTGFCKVLGVQKNDIFEIAKNLGNIALDKRNPLPSRKISPQSTSLANPNTLSSRYGLGAFPFHTDCAHWKIPPQYVLLYCLNPGDGERNTNLIDSSLWSWTSDEKISLISDIFIAALQNPFLCTIAQESSLGLIFRFDKDCMKPVSKKAHTLFESFQNKINESEIIKSDWKVGDLLILNNWRILHSRGESSKPDCRRTLIRVLVGGSYERMAS